MLTNEWPSSATPYAAPYVVRQVAFVEASGAQVDVFSFRGAKSPKNYVQARRELRKAHDLSSYDVIHAQFGQSGLLALPKRRPLVVTLRGSDILGSLGADGKTTFAGKVLRQVTKLVTRAADAVIIVSESQRKHLPPSVRPHLLPSGVDFSRIPDLSVEEARRRADLPLDRRLVLYVGPPTVQKGYDVATAAVQLLASRLPVELVVGWNMSQDEVLLRMRACDALVFPSRQEGSPDVVKEALACDLPIVAARVGDVPERLRGIEGCEVCEDWRPETMCDALERVLRPGKGIEGRAAVQELDEARLTERLLEIYRSAIDTRASGR
jgi:teichuronic acid biosynthesis glycosyltransferase TuaC